MASSNLIDLTRNEGCALAQARAMLPSASDNSRNGSSNCKSAAHFFNPGTPQKRKRGETAPSVMSSFESSSDSEALRSTLSFKGLADGVRSSLHPSRLVSPLAIASHRNYVSPQRLGLAALQSTPSKSRRGFAGQRILSQQALTGRISGTHLHPIEIDEDEDDLTATIRNAYPVFRSVRRLNQDLDLEILESRTFQNHDNDGEDDDEEYSEGADTPEKTQRGFFSDKDFADDYDIPQIIRKLSIADGRSHEEDLRRSKKIIGYKDKERGLSYAEGKSIELIDGTFMRIVEVRQTGTGEKFVRGHLLVREDSLTPTMPKRHNELVWIEPQDAGQIDSSRQALLSEISVAEARRNREIVFTNQKYPKVSSKDDSNAWSNKEQDFNSGPLFCRWKRAVIHDQKTRVVEESFSQLLFGDADNKIRKSKSGEDSFPRIADSRSRSEWRQCVTHLGGSHVSTTPIYDLEGSLTKVQKVRKYTCGDCFCGAGGTSRGAIDAGMYVKWGFDQDRAAIGSYANNFARGGTDCRHEAVDEFIRRVSHDAAVVDVLHVSPPCQTFSHAKTHPTPEQDEKNAACLFSVGQLLSTVRPRLVTMEETDGLVVRHQLWFRALIHIFIHTGYSVRWKVLNCQEYGVPQIRKRLVIIASGPGEKLPPFPQPTHGERSLSRKPLVTINDRILGLRINTPDHNLDTVHYFDIPKAPYDGSSKLAKTLTTGGGVGNYHPSGLRHFTVREQACLQTFPICHNFTGARGITARRRQNGNAVPPVLACAILKTVTDSLRQNDEEKLIMSRIGLVKD